MEMADDDALASIEDDDKQQQQYRLSSLKINPLPSNIITIDQILSNENDDESLPQPLGKSENETEDERDDRERREFMDAIRASRNSDNTVAMSENPTEEVYDQMFDNDDDASYDDTGNVDGERKKSALEILEEQKKGKQLKAVDHSTISYATFRKNLYIVPKALSNLSLDEVKTRRDEIEVKIRPEKGCPVPVDTWEQCGLSERILKLLSKYQLNEPFAIQKQAIPLIMAGRDIIGVAKTGSGKTLAFLLPLFRHIQDQPPLRTGEGPIGLVIAPSRELALQIHNEAKKFAKSLGLRVACIYGGASVADQIADLKRGAEIIVCTPGRMIDILCMHAGKLISFKRITMVIMDEADRMFDMGFEPQIKMILSNIRPDRQTILFSATFPKSIETLAKAALKYPIEVLVGDGKVGTINKDITQIVEVHDENDKFLRLLQLLGMFYEKGSVLVFVDKQEKCDQLFQDLIKAGYPCLSLHGGKDQLDRDYTIHEFKTLIKTVMIATSVAGRGLDVPEIVLVINYNCPNHIEDYVHRVGRTGRAGRKGTAYTFVSDNDEQYASIMIRALKKNGITPAAELVVMADQYKAKVERGEAKKVFRDEGFHGKGYKFDGTEMNESQKMASIQRRAYELEQGIEPTDTTDAFDDEGYNASAVDDDQQKAAISVGVSSSIINAKAAADALGTTATALAKAKATAHSICMFKGLPCQTSIASVVTADISAESKAALAKARLIGAQLASTLLATTSATSATASASAGTASNGIVASESIVDNGKSHFFEEIEINDYPSQVRRKVTAKNGLDDVIERYVVAIIGRGSYVQPGKKVEGTERKLHLLIEGSSEMQVRNAKNEIMRILEEETLRISNAIAAAPSIGRYNVLS